jgi:hypothetical protein
MHSHQNFTFGMLVEEINPVKDAALYCMGGHFCRAADLQLDTGDSIETELAELGEMLRDIISSRPAPGIVSFGAQNCSSCVDSGDKAVMQDVIAKVFRHCFVICVALARNETLQQVKNFCSHTKAMAYFAHTFSQRCSWMAAHPEFTVGFLFAKVNPSEYSDGETQTSCVLLASSSFRCFFR